ncbi:MAG: hypothetical protein CL847_03230 [Crocinitomicaceae bacterium]|nr:hypothetical protein [Crocinitomicaceae bacterium]|tara:strand:+ start:566 stop:1678 length:1113 start_codon:yes stop_codon:yes gene_type:complete
MNFNVLSFLFDNLVASGVIGGYVAISLIVVNVLTHVYKESLTKRVQSSPNRYHPIIGALMGAIPGCGGTIAASIMYKNDKLSFGGLLAAFITTLGEGSFVLLGASTEPSVPIDSNLKAFAIVNIVGLCVGIIVGSLSDALKLKGFNFDINYKMTVKPADIGTGSRSSFEKIIEQAGLYLILGTTLFLTPGSIMALWGGGIASIEEVTVVMCLVMTVASIIYFVVQTFFLNGHCHSVSHQNIRSVLVESVMDITMVISYVFVGLVVANFVIDILVGQEQFMSWMNESELLVVVLAALIGVTPGCGGMIAVAVAYVTIPNFPIAALISAGIATSGDGIFPLFASNKKEALTISVLSLAIAIIVGYGVLFIEM